MVHLSKDSFRNIFGDRVLCRQENVQFLIDNKSLEHLLALLDFAEVNSWSTVLTKKVYYMGVTNKVRR